MKITDYEEAECEVCTQGKMCQTKNREPDQRAKAPLEFVHCDLAGAIEPVAKDGFKYALSFVDDFSGTNMIYFLRQKSDAVEATEKFLADAAPYGKVRRLRSDKGGEFMNNRGIKHETSAPYSPHQNGTVKRTWRTLFNMARCLLLEAKLPKNLWTYVVMTSVYIRNRCFNPRLAKTPYEALICKQPNLSKMHVFGSACYAIVQNPKKLDARGQKGIFVGYDKGSPSYLVFFPETNRVERVRCVKFFDSLKAEQNDHEEIIPARGQFDDEKRENVENEIKIEGVSTNTNEQTQTHEQQEQDISDIQLGHATNQVILDKIQMIIQVIQLIIVIDLKVSQ